jgi:hypothetical protein
MEGIHNLFRKKMKKLRRRTHGMLVKILIRKLRKLSMSKIVKIFRGAYFILNQNCKGENCWWRTWNLELRTSFPVNLNMPRQYIIRTSFKFP